MLAYTTIGEQQINISANYCHNFIVISVERLDETKVKLKLVEVVNTFFVIYKSSNKRLSINYALTEAVVI